VWGQMMKELSNKWKNILENQSPKAVWGLRKVNEGWIKWQISEYMMTPFQQKSVGSNDERIE